MKKYLPATIFLISIFSGILVAGFTSVAQASDFEISDGSVKALWHANDQDVNYLTDSVTGSSTGTISGGCNHYVNGILSKAIECNNTYAGYVSLPSGDNALNVHGTSISFQSWINTSSTADQYIIDAGNSTSGSTDGYTIGLGLGGCSTGHIALYIVNQETCSTVAVNDGTWHQIAFTYNGSSIELYIDGVSDVSYAKSSSINTYTSTRNISARYDANTTYSFTGYIDETFLTNSVLTMSDIATLWNVGTGKEVCITVGCGSSGGGSNTITLTIPTNGYSSTDFSNWQVSVGGDIQNSSIQIKYSPLSASSTWLYTDTRTWHFPYPETGFTVPKSRLLWSVINTTSTSWLAQGYLYSSTGTLLATSTANTFYVSGYQSQPSYGSSSNAISAYTSSTTGITVLALQDCSAYETSLVSSSTLRALGCEFQNLGTKLVQFVLIPGVVGDSYGYLTNAYQDMTQVFPFNIVFGLANTVETALQDNTGQQTLALTIDWPSLPSAGGGTITVGEASTSIPILGASTIVDTLGTTFRDWWYDLVIMLTGLAAARIAYLTIRPRQKHQNHHQKV